jgi:hypothetical protein
MISRFRFYITTDKITTQSEKHIVTSFHKAIVAFCVCSKEFNNFDFAWNNLGYQCLPSIARQAYSSPFSSIVCPCWLGLQRMQNVVIFILRCNPKHWCVFISKVDCCICFYSINATKVCLHVTSIHLLHSRHCRQNSFCSACPWILTYL